MSSLRAFLGALLVVSCGGDDVGTSAFDSGSPDTTSGDSAVAFTLRVDPTSASMTLVLGGVAPSPVAFHAFEKDAKGAETDVTSAVVWTSDGGPIATVDAKGNASAGKVGGKTKVRATLQGVTATADVTVKLTGDVFGGGTNAMTKTKFAGGVADPDPKNAPVLEYPEDGVVLPGNLPAVELQWSQAADNSVYRAHVTAADVLDLYLYSSTRELTPPPDAWAAIIGTVHDTPITWVVDAMGAANPLRTSAARTLISTADTIDQSSIYVWQSSTGSFHVIDITQAKDFVLPTTAPQLQGGQPCSGCHRISRDGKRFAFTYNGGGFNFGTLAYDANAKTYVPKIAPSPAYRATYATFNPNETTQVPAMIVTEPDDVPQNTAGSVRLNMRNPDTNAVVPNDLAAMTSVLPAAVGHATSMPDWSADGSLVVFSAYDSNKSFVRLLGDDIVLASIVESTITYDGKGGFKFGAPKVLVAADPNGNADTGENNVLPASSPDGSAVAFTRAAGWWSIKTQQSLLNLSGQIMLVRRADGQTFELAKGSNGKGTTLSSTWPQWAPTMGNRYAWLAYGSERPYGHELTPQNASCGGLVQGQGSCKQLWVMAIDVQKLKDPTNKADPSSAPFWIPGQNIHAQYVSPQWTKAVLTPPN